MTIKRIYHANSDQIAYRKTEGVHSDQKPGIVFLGGSQSDMNATKAVAIEKYCQKNDRSCIVFDYYGHGQSSGVYEKGTIGQWLKDTLAVIDQLTSGPLILVGSSLGGWLMFLACLERSERIAKLIGISAAPDFTHTLMWPALSDEQKHEIDIKGLIKIPSGRPDSPYIISKQLIESGKKHLILGEDINVTCPVHLFQGMQDHEVPADYPVRIAQKLKSDDVKITIVKNASHGFSKPEHIDLIIKAIETD